MIYEIDIKIEKEKNHLGEVVIGSAVYNGLLFRTNHRYDLRSVEYDHRHLRHIISIVQETILKNVCKHIIETSDAPPINPFGISGNKHQTYDDPMYALYSIVPTFSDNTIDICNDFLGCINFLKQDLYFLGEHYRELPSELYDYIDITNIKKNNPECFL